MNYTAETTTDHGVEIIRLTDQQAAIEVSIAPSIGNRAYEMKVRGGNILWLGADNVAQLKENPGLSGIPFLAPWANRIAGGGFRANGKRYVFNDGLGSTGVDAATGLPIHGMVSAWPWWEVSEVVADNDSAQVTSRLRFWRYPELMANWPFAHEYEMTYRLCGGALEVITTVINHSAAAMPLAIGYHPYFVLPGVPRSKATAHIPARTSVVIDSQFVATGEMRPMDLPDRISLAEHTLDHGFTDLIRNELNRATFWMDGAGKRVEVAYGPNWPVAVVWAPPNQDFICFEPMAAVTNGVNLAHDGKYSALQILLPDTAWRESFWITPFGF